MRRVEADKIRRWEQNLHDIHLLSLHKSLIQIDRVMVSELPLPDYRSGRDHALDGQIL